MKLRSTPSNPAQENEIKITQGTASPFGVKLRRVTSNSLDQAPPQPEAPTAVNPGSPSAGHTAPAAAQVPTPEKAEIEQARCKERVHIPPAADANELQPCTIQAVNKLMQADRVEPTPPDMAGSAPMVHAGVQAAAETVAPKPYNRAEEESQAVAASVVADSLPARSEAPAAPESDAGESSTRSSAPADAAVFEDESAGGSSTRIPPPADTVVFEDKKAGGSSSRIPAPADAVVFEDEKAEAPRSKSIKHQAPQHDIMAGKGPSLTS